MQQCMLMRFTNADRPAVNTGFPKTYLKDAAVMSAADLMSLPLQFRPTEGLVKLFYTETEEVESNTDIASLVAQGDVAFSARP